MDALVQKVIAFVKTHTLAVVIGFGVFFLSGLKWSPETSYLPLIFGVLAGYAAVRTIQ